MKLVEKDVMWKKKFEINFFRLNSEQHSRFIWFFCNSCSVGKRLLSYPIYENIKTPLYFTNFSVDCFSDEELSGDNDEDDGRNENKSDEENDLDYDLVAEEGDSDFPPLSERRITRRTTRGGGAAGQLRRTKQRQRDNNSDGDDSNNLEQKYRKPDHSCDSCGDSFPSAQARQEHGKNSCSSVINTSGRFVCKKCKARHDSPTALRWDLKSSHMF